MAQPPETAITSLLGGAPNFRAVKPYPAAGGRKLRANMIFRSGELSQLSAADQLSVAELNIRLICDLRTSNEQIEYPTRWPVSPAATFLALPDPTDRQERPGKTFELLMSHPGEEGAVKMMEALYSRKPGAYVGNLKRLFETIARGDALPLLIHCHAGKDRTGFTVAMLLAALGVAKADIVDDYVATSIYAPVDRGSESLMRWERSFNLGIDPAFLIPIMEARPGYLETAFDVLERDWGGSEKYLESAVGLTAQLRNELQALLLE